MRRGAVLLPHALEVFVPKMALDKEKKVHNIHLGLHMPLHMESQVVRAREGALAQVTLKGPVSGVLPEVTGQLV